MSLVLCAGPGDQDARLGVIGESDFSGHRFRRVVDSRGDLYAYDVCHDLWFQVMPDEMLEAMAE